MRKVDENRIITSCEQAKKSLIPAAMLAFVPPIQSELQSAMASYIAVFEKAVKGELSNCDLLHDAAQQTMELTTPKMATAMQYCFPTEWEGFVALRPAANQFLPA